MARIKKQYLAHHGILGQKWGVRNGPPYPLGGGDYTAREYQKVYRARRRNPNSIYNKKHFDKVINKGEVLSTLSYDKDRTKNVDMFYATYKKTDKHQYNTLFNRAIPQELYDNKGRKIGSGMYLKYRINNVALNNIRVASEDSAMAIFKRLYMNDRDFYNFVTDANRMQHEFVDSKYKFKGYRESRDALDAIRKKPRPTEAQVETAYRMFNYVIPSDGGGDARRAKDVATQRAKFFRALKAAGYGAVLDTNDSIYGGFKAQAPVIVFDMDQIVLRDANRVSLNDKRFSRYAFIGRRFLGI